METNFTENGTIIMTPPKGRSSISKSIEVPNCSKEERKLTRMRGINKGRTGQQEKQIVRSKRMMGRRAARQTAAVLLFFCQGGRSFGCLFILFLIGFSSSFSDASGEKYC